MVQSRGVDVKPDKNKLDKFRITVDPNLWSDTQLENTIDLTGKKLHLFQLPPNMPISCLDGVELPKPKRKKWSKTVTVSYTADEGQPSERSCSVSIRAHRMKCDDTLMQVTDENLIICDSRPVSVYQGIEVLEQREYNLLPKSQTKHVLPPGLRQRYTPIGNKNKEAVSKVDVEAVVASVRVTVPKSRRKSTVKSEKSIRTPAATPKQSRHLSKSQGEATPANTSIHKTPVVASHTPDTPHIASHSKTKRKIQRNVTSDSENSDVPQSVTVIPQKKSKPTPHKTKSGSTRKSKS